MADLAQKKANFVRRYVDAVDAFVRASDNLGALKSEWDAMAYAAGADPAGNNITDEDLALTAPWIDALQLNQSVGGMVSVSGTLEANRGYLEPVRP